MHCFSSLPSSIPETHITSLAAKVYEIINLKHIVLATLYEMMENQGWYDKVFLGLFKEEQEICICFGCLKEVILLDY